MSESPRHIDFSKQPKSHEDEFFKLPEEEQLFLDTCLVYVEEATGAPAGKNIVSRMPCAIFLEKYYECGGKIMLKRGEDSGRIKWICENCDDEGVITGYEGNEWDLTGIPEEYASQYLFDKYDQHTGEKIEILEGLPFDYDDREQNEELFNWLDSLEEDQKQEMAALFEKRIMLADEEMKRRYAEANGGLTPEQEYRLFVQDWNTPNGPVFLSDDLTFEEVDTSIFMESIRSFLHLLQSGDGFELTPDGTLKPHEIDRILDNGNWPENIIESIRAEKKVLNEMDLWLLHIIRNLLEFSGLIEKDGDRLKPIQEYIHLADYGYACELYKRLFITLFREMNLSYIARHEELPFIQAGLPFTMFRLHQLADDWISPEDVMRQTLPIVTRLELLRSLQANPGKPEDKLSRLVLNPLELFGLMESETVSVNSGRYRKTELFDRFIQFRF